MNADFSGKYNDIHEEYHRSVFHEQIKSKACPEEKTERINDEI